MTVFFCAAWRRMIRCDQDAIVAVLFKGGYQRFDDVLINLFQRLDFCIMTPLM